MFTCEVCQEPATCSVVIVDEDKKEEKKYCEFHAKQFGFLQGQTPSARFERSLGFLRLLIVFIKKENRMPTKEEFSKMGAAGKTEPGPFSENTLAERVSYLEKLVRLIEETGRWPDEAKLPIDPF